MTLSRTTKRTRFSTVLLSDALNYSRGSLELGLKRVRIRLEIGYQNDFLDWDDIPERNHTEETHASISNGLRAVDLVTEQPFA